MGFYATDGKNVKALTAEDVFGAGLDLGADVQPRAFYRIVPFVRRAVRLRTNAVSGVPVTLQRGERDISERPEFAALMGMLQALLWKTEFALCLSQYGAYWKRSTNAAGLNPTPEWLLPQACWPFITAERGLEYIRYVRPWGVEGAGKVDLLPLEEVVYFWQPSLDRANWPGPPPGETAEAAASALANRDRFVAQYFKQGAVKGTLLTVPKTASEDNRNKLKIWWKQIFSGIANAWATNVISEEVKPVIIGDSLKDTESDSLTAQYRQDVAAAFEVPESMLLSNAANFATAREERISFYEETIFPELDLILQAINRQWLHEQYDAELVAHPEQTEARQDAQVQQATAITDLVGAPVLSVDEGRAWLGLEPMDTNEEAAPADEAADYQAMAQAEEQAEIEAEEQAEIEAEEEAKALPSGGRAMRAAERAVLRVEHRANRELTQVRHQQERKLLRDGHLEVRRSATDAGARLRLVHRHKAEAATLGARQAAERSMMRSLHAAERGRLRDRHAVERAFERNGHEEVLL